jgi:hypothetical protein
VIRTRCELVFQTDSQITSLATGLQGDTAWDILLKPVCCAFTMLKRLKDSHPTWPRPPGGRRSGERGPREQVQKVYSHVLLSEIERWELIE